jgi:hypothetical protein
MKKRILPFLILGFIIGIFGYACDDSDDEEGKISVVGNWYGTIDETNSDEDTKLYVKIDENSDEYNAIETSTGMLVVGTYIYNEADKELTMNNKNIGNIERTVTDYLIPADLPTYIKIQNLTFSEDGNTISGDTVDSLNYTGTISLTRQDSFPSTGSEVFQTSEYTQVIVNVSLENYNDSIDWVDKYVLLSVNDLSDKQLSMYIAKIDSVKEAVAMGYIENSEFDKSSIFSIMAFCLPEQYLPGDGEPTWPEGTIYLGSQENLTKESKSNIVNLSYPEDQITMK